MASAGGPYATPPNKRTICVSPWLPSSMQRPEWMLDDFKLHSEVYRGKASVVYVATDSISGSKVVLKLYRKSKLTVLTHSQVMREMRIHVGLQHENIIKLFAAFEDEKNLYLVLERGLKGDLYSELERQGGKVNEAVAVREIIAPMINVLMYLHSKGVLHRDVKPENILLAPGNVIKLADFGLSINVAEEAAVTRAGTLDYMAPEILLCPEKKRPEEFKDSPHMAYNAKAEAWAIGILTYEVLVGVAPFEGEDCVLKTKQRIVTQDVEMPLELGANAQDFIRQALTKSPEARPSLAQLSTHPFIAQLTAKTVSPATSLARKLSVVGGTATSLPKQASSLSFFDDVIGAQGGLTPFRLREIAQSSGQASSIARAANNSSSPRAAVTKVVAQSPASAAVGSSPFSSQHQQAGGAPSPELPQSSPSSASPAAGSSPVAAQPCPPAAGVLSSAFRSRLGGHLHMERSHTMNMLTSPISDLLDSPSSLYSISAVNTPITNSSTPETSSFTRPPGQAQLGHLQELDQQALRSAGSSEGGLARQDSLLGYARLEPSPSMSGVPMTGSTWAAHLPAHPAHRREDAPLQRCASCQLVPAPWSEPASPVAATEVLQPQPPQCPSPLGARGSSALATSRSYTRCLSASVSDGIDPRPHTASSLQYPDARLARKVSTSTSMDGSSKSSLACALSLQDVLTDANVPLVPLSIRDTLLVPSSARPSGLCPRPPAPSVASSLSRSRSDYSIVAEAALQHRVAVTSRPLGPYRSVATTSAPSTSLATPRIPFPPNASAEQACFPPPRASNLGPPPNYVRSRSEYGGRMPSCLGKEASQTKLQVRFSGAALQVSCSDAPGLVSRSNSYGGDVTPPSSRFQRSKSLLADPQVCAMPLSPQPPAVPRPLSQSQGGRRE